MNIDSVLAAMDLHPILVDVGASGAPPPIWASLAARSIYVGFDPDAREMREIPNGAFYKHYILNQAVTAETDQAEVEFYLTRSPFCSSTLPPNHVELSDYLFADFFTVERQARVPAITLAEMLTRLSLTQIDWLKVDSQGTDLRLFMSLAPELRERVLALDIEPGLIPAYAGEDTFVEAHRTLLDSGFWLSNLSVKGAVRMRAETLARLAEQDVTRPMLERVVSPSPGWVEARYFRTTAWLRRSGASQRDVALLWACAVADQQLGFALDVVSAWDRAFGTDELSQHMHQATLAMFRRSPRYWRARISQWVPARWRSWLSRLRGRG